MEKRGFVIMKKQNGFVMMWAVFSVVLILLLGIAFLDMTIANYDLIIKNSRNIKTAWIAEAGIAKAFHDLRKDFFSVASKYQEDEYMMEDFGADNDGNGKEDGIFIASINTKGGGTKQFAFVSDIVATSYLVEEDNFKSMSDEDKEKATKTTYSAKVKVYPVLTDYALYVSRSEDAYFVNNAGAQSRIAYTTNGLRVLDEEEGLWFVMNKTFQSVPSGNSTLSGPVFFDVPYLRMSTNVIGPAIDGPVLTFTGDIDFFSEKATYEIGKNGNSTERYTVGAGGVADMAYKTTNGLVLDPKSGSKMIKAPKINKNTLKKFYKDLIDESWKITSMKYVEIPDYAGAYESVSISSNDNAEQIRAKLSPYRESVLVDPVAFLEVNAELIEDVGGVYEEGAGGGGGSGRPREPGTYPYDVFESDGNWDKSYEAGGQPPEHGSEGTDPNNRSNAKPKDYGNDGIRGVDSLNVPGDSGDDDFGIDNPVGTEGNIWDFSLDRWRSGISQWGSRPNGYEDRDADGRWDYMEEDIGLISWPQYDEITKVNNKWDKLSDFVEIYRDGGGDNPSRWWSVAKYFIDKNQSDTNRLTYMNRAVDEKYKTGEEPLAGKLLENSRPQDPKHGMKYEWTGKDEHGGNVRSYDYRYYLARGTKITDDVINMIAEWNNDVYNSYRNHPYWNYDKTRYPNSFPHAPYSPVKKIESITLLKDIKRIKLCTLDLGSIASFPDSQVIFVDLPDNSWALKIKGNPKEPVTIVSTVDVYLGDINAYGNKALSLSKGMPVGIISCGNVYMDCSDKPIYEDFKTNDGKRITSELAVEKVKYGDYIDDKNDQKITDMKWNEWVSQYADGDRRTITELGVKPYITNIADIIENQATLKLYNVAIVANNNVFVKTPVNYQFESINLDLYGSIAMGMDVDDGLNPNTKKPKKKNERVVFTDKGNEQYKRFMAVCVDMFGSKMQSKFQYNPDFRSLDDKKTSKIEGPPPHMIIPSAKIVAWKKAGKDLK